MLCIGGPKHGEDINLAAGPLLLLALRRAAGVLLQAACHDILGSLE